MCSGSRMDGMGGFLVCINNVVLKLVNLCINVLRGF